MHRITVRYKIYIKYTALRKTVTITQPFERPQGDGDGDGDDDDDDGDGDGDGEKYISAAHTHCLGCSTLQKPVQHGLSENTKLSSWRFLKGVELACSTFLEVHPSCYHD